MLMLRRFTALAAIVLLAAACTPGGGTTDPTEDGSGGELQATRWVLSSYASEGALVIVPADQYADADFRAQRVKGFGGCNDYDAVYRTGGRMLLIGAPMMTLAACGDTANAFEAGYTGLLQQSRFYNVRAGTLTIRGSDRAVLLVFDAAPVNPLRGSWVVASYKDASGALVAPLEDTELTVVFRIVKVGGSAGCNTFDGPYTTNGTVAVIGPLATTRMACAEDVMAQESSFLAALQGVGLVVQRAGSVELQDRTGGILVALSQPSAPEPSPSATAQPVASVAPSATPTAKPTATPTAKPTVAPTPTPTPAASAPPAPTIAPPASLPPVATCNLTTADGVAIATVVYPAGWFTVTAPPTMACRYFDPAVITVPADPATLTTAVMVKADLTVPYADALAAATNPANWTVLTNEPVTDSGLPASRLQATSIVDGSGFPVGVTRYGYLIDLGGGSAWIQTSGTLGDPTYVEYMLVVDLIASQSTITPPP
jgi:heat shock protein HslJ